MTKYIHESTFLSSVGQLYFKQKKIVELPLYITLKLKATYIIHFTILINPGEQHLHRANTKNILVLLNQPFLASSHTELCLQSVYFLHVRVILIDI